VGLESLASFGLLSGESRLSPLLQGVTLKQICRLSAGSINPGDKMASGDRASEQPREDPETPTRCGVRSGLVISPAATAAWITLAGFVRCGDAVFTDGRAEC